MAALIGRDVVLTWDSVAVAGGKTTGMTINNTAVDVTTNDSSGWRTLLAESGQQNVDLTISGILVDSTLMAASISGDTTAATLFTFPKELDGDTASGPVIGGTFKMVSFATGEETEAGVTFDASFQSSGEVTFTAGA